MSAYEELAKAFHEHCLGATSPAGALEGTGVLLKSWVDGYLALLERATQSLGAGSPCPVEVLTAIQAASFSLTAKYENWHRWTAGTNAETERLLGLVRREGDRFLQARLGRPAPTG